MPEQLAPEQDKRKGVLLSIAGTVFIATYFITGKYALDKEHGFSIETFCMLWTGACAVMSFIFVVGVGHLRRIRLKRASIPGMAGLGLTTGIGMILLYGSLRLLDPSFTAFLARAHPLLVILMSLILLKERLRLMEVLPMVVMFAGGVACAWGRWPQVGTGMMMAILSYVMWAIHRVFTKTE